MSDHTQENGESLADVAVHEMRVAARAVLGGNCAYVDDDAALLAAYAKWAIDNGCPRDINPVITDKARHVSELQTINADLLASLKELCERFDTFGDKPYENPEDSPWFRARAAIAAAEAEGE